MLDFKEHLTASRATLHRFGLLFAGIAAAAAAALLWKAAPSWPAPLVAAVIFLSLAFAVPEALRPLYVVWMTLGALLAWVNTRIILGVLFFVVMTPLGWILRLVGKDLLSAELRP